MKRAFQIAACACWLSGCVGNGERRGEPLYPATGRGPLTLAEVAEVSGAVQSIDDKPVRAGRRYEVLPGCHVLRSSTRWGGSDAYTAVSATLPSLPFSIDMRPGYKYLILIQQGLSTGSGGTLSIVAEEQDRSGVATRRFQSGAPCAG